MTFTRAFPCGGRVVFLHADSGAPPYWIATISGTDIFTGILYLGDRNADQVTELVTRWIDQGAIPMEHL